MSAGRDAASRPVPPMLRDEATDWLLGKLEGESCGTLSVRVENGHYQAAYETPEQTVQGDWLPNLTDALASLIGETE